MVLFLVNLVKVQMFKSNLSCLIIPQVHFESNGKLSKAAALPGEKPAPNVGGLKLKPGLGMRQIDGAASNSPTTPTSPLILAKNPFAEVGSTTARKRHRHHRARASCCLSAACRSSTSLGVLVTHEKELMVPLTCFCLLFDK